jgi:hypothetical protein
MAARGWGGSIATAIGVAAGAGAAQLGVGYGLGVISWQPAGDASSTNAWVASLAWATWIASTSAVAGAICADRLSPAAASTVEGPGGAPGPLATSLWRVALALSAAIGALVTVPLVAVPARIVVRPDTSSPQTIAGGYAVIGVILGLIVAIGALTSRAVATNVIASVSWLWLLAIVAVVDGVAGGRGVSAAQLGVWQFTSSGPVARNIHVWEALLTLGAAAVIGALAALPAARRGDSGVGIAMSGAIGPLLVAAAYFLAAPKLTGVEQHAMSPYLVAPYAVITGLISSAAVAGLAPRLQQRKPVVATKQPAESLPKDAFAAPRARASVKVADQGTASPATPAPRAST